MSILERMWLKIVIVSVLCVVFIPASGFLKGTLVKTLQGFCPIESLKKDDLVISYDFNGNFIAKPVVAILQRKVARFVECYIGGECIKVALRHKLYNILDKKWIYFEDLPLEQLCLNANLFPLGVEHICIQEHYVDVYDIAVEEYRNFCITPHNIIVHNFAPAVAIGFSWVFGSGALEFLGGSVFVTALGALFGFKWQKEKNKHQFYFINSACSGGAPGPEDPENKWHNQNQNNSAENGRKQNSISKKEFFNSIQNEYQHLHSGIYKRLSHAKGIAGAEYLQWDNLHGDIEAYNKSKMHIGSIDPLTKMLYKLAERGRKINI